MAIFRVAKIETTEKIIPRNFILILNYKNYFAISRISIWSIVPVILSILNKVTGYSEKVTDCGSSRKCSEQVHYCSMLPPRKKHAAREMHRGLDEDQELIDHVELIGAVVL